MLTLNYHFSMEVVSIKEKYIYHCSSSFANTNMLKDHLIYIYRNCFGFHHKFVWYRKENKPNIIFSDCSQCWWMCMIKTIIIDPAADYNHYEYHTLDLPKFLCLLSWLLLINGMG